jgi:CubicO group peptidase (beta-lactamase class C family)
MKKIILLFLLFISYQTNAQTYFPPIGSADWDTTSAQSLGWCTGEPLDSLYSFLKYRNSKAFIVLKDGKIVLEKYFGTFGVDSNWYWASAGKTLIGYAIGIAQQENLLNINNKTSQYLGSGWSSCTPLQEDSITLWHQLTMTTGLNDNVPDDNCVIDTCLQYLAPVNTRWAYYNASYRLLQDVIDSAASPTCNGYVQQKIRTKIGMNGIFFNNINYSTARSMARFGLLLSNNGKWDATTILADTNYLKDMRNSSQSINKAYGYLTWLNGKADYMLPSTQLVFNGKLNPNAPDDMYAAMGKDGQIINVVPSKNLVVIRMGNNPMDGSLVPTTFNSNLWQYLNAVMCTPNAIVDINKKINFTIYPNPAQEKIIVSNINNANAEVINIFNIYGQKCLEQNIKNGDNTINIKQLLPGNYVVKLGNACQLLTKQ